jgi:excisionase family DNA binding protein
MPPRPLAAGQPPLFTESEIGRARLTRADVMRAEQVAELVGISRRTVYLWARQGKLPCRRRGHVVLFLRAEIVAWLVDPAADF